jgi:hypothetical protein
MVVVVCYVFIYLFYLSLSGDYVILIFSTESFFLTLLTASRF